MPTTQHSLAVIALISICIGSSTAWSNLPTLASAPASETKIDFDQVFANAVGRAEFDASIQQKLREVGWNALGDVSINRQRKSDRLPALKSGLPEPVLLPYCEPVAARFADPILGRVLGRCMV